MPPKDLITIVNYGLGNIGSIQNMFKRVGVATTVASDSESLKAAAKIVLPGVGHFDRAMNALNSSGLKSILMEKAREERVPVLGICLGMQLLTLGSEEGTQPGLGLIPVETKKFPASESIKVPHMGWNSVSVEKDDRLVEKFDSEFRYYFVHSYRVTMEKPEFVLLSATHGQKFAAAISVNQIYGVQFHPEKSHRFGMHLLNQFAQL